MNITEEAHQLKAMYYDEYTTLCLLLDLQAVSYNDFNLDIMHELRTKGLKKIKNDLTTLRDEQ